MVEIFKTNVTKSAQAQLLIKSIKRTFPGYTASFDLEDCDHVLRVQCATAEPDTERLVKLLHDFGLNAEILEDEIHYSYSMHAAAQHEMYLTELAS